MRQVYSTRRNDSHHRRAADNSLDCAVGSSKSGPPVSSTLMPALEASLEEYTTLWKFFTELAHRIHVTDSSTSSNSSLYGDQIRHQGNRTNSQRVSYCSHQLYQQRRSSGSVSSGTLFPVATERSLG